MARPVGAARDCARCDAPIAYEPVHNWFCSWNCARSAQSNIPAKPAPLSPAQLRTSRPGNSFTKANEARAAKIAARIAAGEKRCSSCGHSKPLDAFSSAPSMADGFYAYCRLCASQRQAQRRARLAEQARAKASGGAYSPADTVSRLVKGSPMVAATDKMHTRLFFERALRGAAPNLPGATCSSGKYPPEVWFPRGTDRPGREFAVNLCLGCAAYTECLSWATSSCRLATGIVAGLSARERKAQREQRQQAGAA